MLRRLVGAAGRWAVPRPLAAVALGSARPVSVQGIDLRPGDIIETDGQLRQVAKSAHTQGLAGRRGNVQVEYRDLKSGLKTVQRYRPDEAVERVSLESREYQLLYVEGNTAHVIHAGTHEQLELPRSLFGEGPTFKLLQDGMVINVAYFEGEPVTARLAADTWVFVVKEADPTVKGQSVAATFKTAVLATDPPTEIQVPPYVAAGDSIVVDVTTGDFVRRAAKE